MFPIYLITYANLTSPVGTHDARRTQLVVLLLGIYLFHKYVFKKKLQSPEPVSMSPLRMLDCEMSETFGIVNSLFTRSEPEPLDDSRDPNRLSLQSFLYTHK